LKNFGTNPLAIHLTESTWSSPIQLDEYELQSLRKVRDEWARLSSHWSTVPNDGEKNRETYVLDIRPEANGLWQIRVNDAIGAIDLGTSVVIVSPKIPIAHFAYIAERALVPADRMRSDRAQLGHGEHFLELIASWTLLAIERVVRDGLIRDYSEQAKRVSYFQGKVDIFRSTRNILRGNLNFDSRIDVFSANNPLNRSLKQALNVLLRNQLLHADVRKRAARALKHFGEVGQFSNRDLKVVLSRNSLRYEEALDFTKHLLVGTGRTLESGPSRAHSFLYKTPSLIEEGIRRIVRDGLSPTKVIKTSKQMRTLPSSRFVSVNPDLAFESTSMFDGLIVGDIKYKIQSKDWKRNDLAQAVFFAAAFESPKALILDFADTEKIQELGDVAIGKIAVSALSWDIAESSSPAESEKRIITQVSDWLETDKLLLLNQDQKLTA
jgi:hypothetical protein